MMTMSRAMPWSFLRCLIISVLAGLLAVVAGCSTVRFGYNHGPDIAYWWLDGYVDFTDAQTPQAREAIAGWFRWHRDSELTDYAALLDRAQAEVLDNVTPAQTCGWVDRVTGRLRGAFAAAVPTIAEVARTLTPQQLVHLQHKQAKNNDQYRADFLEGSPEDRFKASVKRVVERAESFYGRLEEAQRVRIAQRVAESPFDAERWLAERQQRQQDLVQALRRISSSGISADEAQAALRALLEDTLNSPREGDRQYQQRLEQYNCTFAAEIHNLATAQQRQRAAKKLKSWEDDLRALAATR
jgi:hypothetical protein